MFEFTVDLSNLEQLFGNITTFAREAPKWVADFVIAEIIRKTKEGVDADGTTFSQYSKAHRAKRQKAKLQVDQKDLRFTGAMMDSLALTHDAKDWVVNVAEQFQDIAHGQMFHPNWKPESHSKFLMVGSADESGIEQVLLEQFEKIKSV